MKRSHRETSNLLKIIRDKDTLNNEFCCKIIISLFINCVDDLKKKTNHSTEIVRPNQNAVNCFLLKYLKQKKKKFSLPTPNHQQNEYTSKSSI